MTKAPNDAAIDPGQTIADLQRRLDESLAREIATAEVMSLINASPGDLAPVFDAIVDNAIRFCEAGFGGLWLVEDDLARAAATRNLPDKYIEYLTRHPVPQADAFGPNMKDRPAVHVVDLAATESYRRRSPVTVASVELGGIRSYLAVPLRDGNTLAGVLSLYRKEVRPFTERQIALVQTFADQAVIAIKNARLFDEVQSRTRDVEDALQQQIATAQVLQVISSSMADAKPVFERIVDSIDHLLDNLQIGIFLTPGDEMVHFAAGRGGTIDALKSIYPLPVEGSAVPAVIGARQQVYYGDVLNDPDVPESMHSREGSGEHRSADINALVEESLNLAYHGARAEKSST